MSRSPDRLVEEPDVTADAGPVARSASEVARDAAFERDALPWLDDVYRFALSLTREESDADDVVQETFLRAYRSWHTFIPGTDCRRWLFTICRNVFLRSRERQRPTVDLEDGEQDAVAASSVYAAARERGYDDIFARLDLAPALREALDELAEPFRSAVILVDVEDMSYESAAEVMGVPIGTVRSRLFRGRRLLQEKLATVARISASRVREPGDERSGTLEARGARTIGDLCRSAASPLGLPRRPDHPCGRRTTPGPHRRLQTVPAVRGLPGMLPPRRGGAAPGTRRTRIAA